MGIDPVFVLQANKTECELGNLQSEGHGIAGFQTMLSIGLGQDQQFTLILQTLQQLKDVYGESVDKIVQGNVSNIVFLKSTDDSMIQTLSTMSGQTHKTYRDSKTTTKDLEKLAMQAEGKISYTWNTRQVPVIEYTDFAYIPPRNSIVFRAGDSPIWNRNETILPMSWKLFSDTIKVPGKEFSLQTVPTLSTVLDFDVRKNTPDFMQMFAKRLKQAEQAPKFMKAYKEVYHYSEYDIMQLDPDVYAEEIMAEINDYLAYEERQQMYAQNMSDDYIKMMEEASDDDFDDYGFASDEPLAGYQVSDNDIVTQAVQEDMCREAERTKPRYAGNMISRRDLVRNTGQGNLDSGIVSVILKVYLDTVGYFKKDSKFRVTEDNCLYASMGGRPFVVRNDLFQSDLHQLNHAAKSSDSTVYADGSVDAEEVADGSRYRVTADFLEYLASLPTWAEIAGGEFDKLMAVQMRDGSGVSYY